VHFTYIRLLIQESHLSKTLSLATIFLSIIKNGLPKLEMDAFLIEAILSGSLSPFLAIL